MTNPFGLDDPSLAILPDPPTLPGNASLREALTLVRGSLDCQIPATADGNSSAPKAPVLGENTGCVLVENFSTTSETFRQLQQHGIRIAIDDFGTGYASLSYLQHFSFDILKIDRSFISELHHQPRNQAIVDSIMRLSEHLDFDLVAEGVESHFEQDLLEGMGRPIYIQGYYVSPPLEAEAWPAFLAGRAATAACSTTSQLSLPSPQEL